MKTPPSPQRKAVAKHILRFFQGDPVVHAYYDEARVRSFSMLTTLDTIEKGIKSIGTIGLSEIPLIKDDGAEFITRIEICSAVPTDVTLWENVVVSAAFFIEQRRTPLTPGSIIEGVVAEYYPTSKMPHLFFTVPFLWNEGYFEELEYSGVKINWLQCLPIFDEEREYVYNYGVEKFESLLAEQEIDVFDFDRQPVIFGTI